jgi:hypothetical protein
MKKRISIRFVGLLAVLLVTRLCVRAGECDGTGSVDDCDGPAFILGFDDCPNVVTGSPGEIKTFEVYATLETRKNETVQGVEGWSTIMTARGGSIREIGMEGMSVRTGFDADGDPATPQVPYEFNLKDADIQFVGMARAHQLPEDWDPNQPVAAAAVVFDFDDRIQLEPSGRQRIARLVVEVRIPDDGGLVPVAMEYIDRIYNPHIPLENSITFARKSWRPFREACVPHDSSTPFRRGDFNSDGQVDISDPVATLSFLFLGGAAPGCLDSADSNNDGLVDLSDPLFTLGDFFINPYPWSFIPGPGPFECGTDPGLDALGCDAYPVCF